MTIMTFDIQEVDQNCIECENYPEKCKGQTMCEWIKENCKKDFSPIDK